MTICLIFLGHKMILIVCFFVMIIVIRKAFTRYGLMVLTTVGYGEKMPESGAGQVQHH